MTKHRKASEAEIIAALKNTSMTCREVGKRLGYSHHYMSHLAQLHGIRRKRGGDRRSAPARARFGVRRPEA